MLASSWLLRGSLSHCVRRLKSAKARRMSVKRPPEAVRGMTEFEPSAFDKEISVPMVDLPSENASAARSGSSSVFAQGSA